MSMLLTRPGVGGSPSGEPDFGRRVARGRHEHAARGAARPAADPPPKPPENPYSVSSPAAPTRRSWCAARTTCILGHEDPASRRSRRSRFRVVRAVRVRRHGGPEVLALETLDDPAPAPGEALVRLEAVGVNFIDCYFRAGLYRAALPFTPGSEGAGVVVAVGDGVKDVA